MFACVFHAHLLLVMFFMHLNIRYMDHKFFFNILLNVCNVLNTANVAHVCSICSYNIVLTLKQSNLQNI